MFQTNPYALCVQSDFCKSLSPEFMGLSPTTTKLALVEYKLNEAATGHPPDPPPERTPKHLFLMVSLMCPKFDVYNYDHDTMGAFINANLPTLDDYLCKGDLWLLTRFDLAMATVIAGTVNSTYPGYLNQAPKGGSFY